MKTEHPIADFFGFVFLAGLVWSVYYLLSHGDNRHTEMHAFASLTLLGSLFGGLIIGLISNAEHSRF